MYQRDLQILATEMYKILNGVSPDIMKDILETENDTVILVMRQYFPQEILKQTWITDHLLHGSENLETCTQRDETIYYYK